MSSTFTLAELAQWVDGEIIQGELSLSLKGIASIREAGEGEVSFLGNARYASALKTTRASALLLPRGQKWSVSDKTAVVAVENPSVAFNTLIRKLAPKKVFSPGVDPSVVLGREVSFEKTAVALGPHVVIEDQVCIGEGTTIGAGCYLGRGSRVGKGCILYPHVTIGEGTVLGDRVIVHSGVVLGADGYGFEFVQGKHKKIEQIGVVQIDDDVEIGANTTIDRARFGKTWIGEGTKIDNLVQIGHNVVIGKHCLIVAQVGIAGSVRIGDYVTIAAQVGIAGHLEIGEKVVVMGKSVVTKNLQAGGIYLGNPAVLAKEEKKRKVLTRKLPELFTLVKKQRDQ